MRHYQHNPHHPNPELNRFLFATGIENSYPVITGKDGRPFRVDEMAETGHYQHWREDFQLVRDLGLHYLRYGPPYYRCHLGPGHYDWSFADETFAELKRQGITPIADLCHFGVPDWIGGFQDPDWPELFAAYAEAFARRFSWVTLFTPVNEIFIAAAFSARQGWWNERLKSERAFVTAIKHLARANLLAEEAILRAQPEALFIQSESTQYFHAEEPAALEEADFENQKRFVPLDLCYGHDVSARVYSYLLDNGLTPEEYRFFQETAATVKCRCVMGNDYYATNEQMVSVEGQWKAASGEIFGYYVITKQYYERYHLPVMHTETNVMDADLAPQWLRKEWANMMRLREDGVPILGFTWYSLTDQIDWDIGLREHNGRVNPLGLYDLDRKIRPVGEAYKLLVQRWRDILRGESLCYSLHLPIVSKS